MTVIAHKPSSFNPEFYGCPFCDWPLPHDGDFEEWENTGGCTCPCGAFVALPDPPTPPEKSVRDG